MWRARYRRCFPGAKNEKLVRVSTVHGVDRYRLNFSLLSVTEATVREEVLLCKSATYQHASTVPACTLCVK